MSFSEMQHNERVVNFLVASNRTKTKRKNNGVVCHATRSWKAKRMPAGRKKRERGGLARSPFSALASAFLVFCLSGKKKSSFMEAERACYHGEGRMKGILDYHHTPPGGLRWPLSIDNAPIRRYVPRNAIPFTGETQNYVKSTTGCTMRLCKGWLTWGGWAVARRFQERAHMRIVLRTCKVI